MTNILNKIRIQKFIKFVPIGILFVFNLNHITELIKISKKNNLMSLDFNKKTFKKIINFPLTDIV